MEIVLTALIFLLFGAHCFPGRLGRVYLLTQGLACFFGTWGLFLSDSEALPVHPWIWGWGSLLLLASGVCGVLAYFTNSFSVQDHSSVAISLEKNTTKSLSGNTSQAKSDLG